MIKYIQFENQGVKEEMYWIPITQGLSCIS